MLDILTYVLGTLLLVQFLLAIMLNIICRAEEKRSRESMICNIVTSLTNRIGRRLTEKEIEGFLNMIENVTEKTKPELKEYVNVLIDLADSKVP